MLAPGTTLGSYEIAGLLGAGGMGEVYRARDTRLHRDVALKVLPVGLSSDPDRVVRFEREAQMLGALNHPNIAAVYGIEQNADTAALVLELVDGPTLADRIAHAPIPLDEALDIARQIAEARGGTRGRYLSPRFEAGEYQADEEWYRQGAGFWLSKAH